MEAMMRSVWFYARFRHFSGGTECYAMTDALVVVRCLIVLYLVVHDTLQAYYAFDAESGYSLNTWNTNFACCAMSIG